MEPPKTLDDVRAAKGVFPADEIEPGDTVLDLMCAGFWGANAAIHVLDRKPSRYVGVDIDGAKLDVMRGIYPADVCEFRRELAERVIADIDDLADVLICDPWTQGIPEWMDRLGTLSFAASRVVILGTCDSWLKAHGLEPTPESLNGWAIRGPILPTFRKCTRVIRRSDHLGGTFWTVWR
jgi:hypothetical protein